MAEELNLGISVDVKKLKEVRDELKRLKALALEANTAEEMAEAAEKAGILRDELQRVNEQAAIFTSGSKFEQVSNAFGLMGSQLASLDFEGAAESALLLQNRINSISTEEVTKQLRGLVQMFGTLGKIGLQALGGLVKQIASVGRAFMAFGMQLLANPIFLFAAAVIAIVAAIALLLNKLGLLKPILGAIGYVFELIVEEIEKVVQTIKDFLDMIGLTNYAAEEAAKRQTEASEKRADAYERAAKTITESLDHEIRMNQINGKSTVDLELQKQKLIRQTARVRLEALKAKLQENKLTGEMDQEELKALYEKIAAQNELIRGANYSIAEIQQKDRVDRKKKADDQAKEDRETADKNAKESAEKAKQYRADRLAAERQLRDTELALMAEGVEKEVAENTEKYRRLIEDTKKNEKLLSDEKRQQIKLYEQQAAADEAKIREEAFKAKQERDKAEADEIRAASEESLKAVQARAEAEIMAELEKNRALAELATLRNENDLGAQLALLEAQKQIELSNKELTELEKSVIEERYRKQRESAEEASAERRKAIERQVMEATQQGLESIGSISDFVFDLQQRHLKDGSAAEERAAKLKFEINKKLQIAQAIQQGYQATLAAYASGSAIPVVGSVTGPLFAIAAAAVALKKVNEIRSTSFSGGGSGGGSTGGGGATAAPSAQGTGTSAPGFNLFQSGNGGNTTESSEPTSTNLVLTVENKISESEVTGIQKKVIKYESNSTLTNG